MEMDFLLRSCLLQVFTISALKRKLDNKTVPVKQSIPCFSLPLVPESPFYSLLLQA